MEPLDIFLSHTFSSLEAFLQKATTLNIFEALIFNYKIKVNSVEQCSPQIIAFVVDLCNELQIILRDNIGVIEKSGSSFCQQQPLNAEFIELTSLDNESDIRAKDQWNLTEHEIVASVPNEPIVQTDEPNNIEEKQSAIYTCDNCKRKYRTGGKFSKHLCKCKSASFSVDDLIDDQNSLEDEEFSQVSRVSATSMYVCAVCFATYSQQESFQNHKHDYNNSQEVELLTDSEQLGRVRKFTCGECDEVYRSLARISYHVARCRGGPYQCELCPHVAVTKQLLNGHKKKTHKDVESFFCPECGLGFKLRTSLQKHMVNRHESEQGAFTCDVTDCKRTFPKKIHLTNHKINAHGLEGKFLCQVCGHKFMTQDSLSSHFESHSNRKKFQCRFCEKTFTAKEKLTFHVRIHTGEKPFSCHHHGCSKLFVSKAKLVEHLHRHSGARRHKCAVCAKRYANKTDLRLHIRNVHPEPQDKPVAVGEQNGDMSVVGSIPEPEPEPQLVLHVEGGEGLREGEGGHMFASALPYSCYSQPLQLVTVPQSIIIASYDAIIGEAPRRVEAASVGRSWENKWGPWGPSTPAREQTQNQMDKH